MPQPISLTVVLGYESTLAKLDEIGIFDREMALLRHLQKRGFKIRILSYGGKEELDFASRIQGMGILCNRANLPRQTYIRRIHQLHMLPLLKSDVLRNWQTSGLVTAHRASWAWQTPLVLRMDYYWSQLARIRQPAGSSNADRIKGMERKAVASAARIIVTSQELAASIVEMSPAAAPKIAIIPNFVDADRFRPIATAKRFDLVFIGRISPEKNLGALLQAIKPLSVSIAMIGGRNLSLLDPARDEDEEMKLKREFGTLDGRIHWLGRIKNEELPTLISQARALILCSLIEGNPRTLIEAMACGMPVIGANVPGIRSVIEHEATGYLCGTDAESIRAAVKTVLSDPELMRKLGENARRYALEHFSLEQQARREFELLRDVVRRHPVRPAPRRLAEYLLRRNPPYDLTVPASLE